MLSRFRGVGTMRTKSIRGAMSAFLRPRDATPPRLAMSILVRDEARLIHHHLAFHRYMGVDCFVITDNGSVDGTNKEDRSVCDLFESEAVDVRPHPRE